MQDGTHAHAKADVIVPAHQNVHVELRLRDEHCRRKERATAQQPALG
jgi:hypothetical protein